MILTLKNEKNEIIKKDLELNNINYIRNAYLYEQMDMLDMQSCVAVKLNNDDEIYILESAEINGKTFSANENFIKEFFNQPEVTKFMNIEDSCLFNLKNVQNSKVLLNAKNKNSAKLNVTFKDGKACNIDMLTGNAKQVKVMIDKEITSQNVNTL